MCLLHGRHRSDLHHTKQTNTQTNKMMFDRRQNPCLVEIDSSFQHILPPNPAHAKSMHQVFCFFVLFIFIHPHFFPTNTGRQPILLPDTLRGQSGRSDNNGNAFASLLDEIQ